MVRAVVAVAALALMLVVSAGGGTTSLVRGVVVRGPIAPVCVEGLPCTAPLAFATIVFSRDRSAVAGATTDQSGRFSIRLSPGTYGVAIRGRGALARLSPRAVRVRASEPTWLRLELDTGIRLPGPRIGD